MRKFWLRAGLLIIIAPVASTCGTSLDPPATPQTGLSREPMISRDPAAGTASMTVSVLVYNVAGLPWPVGCNKQSRDLDDQGERIPIACNRSAAMKFIGDSLGEMRKRGTEPDIVLIQEAFISAAAEIPARGGYPNWIVGPHSRELGPRYSERASSEFLEQRSFWKGEKMGKLQSSGLLMASNFSIVERYAHPFNQWECAGYDCLANKGLLLAELEIPGLPQRLAVTTTHYNARGASGVSNDRALTAHNLQVADSNTFYVGLDKRSLPLIWGGDLNMRHAPDRYNFFIDWFGDELNEVSSFCLDPASQCEIREHWDTDTPWYDTQDLQGWAPGALVQIRPTRVEALFDEPVDGLMPSDHNGLLVHYRLSWPVAPGPR